MSEHCPPGDSAPEGRVAKCRAIRRVLVIGAGTMGHGIAHVSAVAGYDTRLFDVDATVLEQAMARVRANLDKGVAKGKLSEAQAGEALARLHPCDQLERACDGADIVVEAVPERLALKHKVLGTAAAHVTETCILATNTSSLSIAAIAEPLPHPERVIGTHFFNPVHIMRLLEIVTARGTDPQVIETVRAWGVALGKETIIVNDVPGFATSRLGLALGLEAIRMVEEGVASPADIDKAMTLGYGHPMGPLRLTDLVGLDVRLHIAQYLSEQLPQGGHFAPPALLRDMVAQGKLGQKSGAGFYEWDDDKR